RQKQKDFYDLAYVLLYNRAGGPIQAADAILRGPSRAHVVSLARTLGELRERFRDASSPGTIAFVELHEIAVPGGDKRQLAQDAVGAVGVFVGRLLDVIAA